MSLVEQPFVMINSGMDLSHYAEQLAEFRESRTINLRKSINLVKNRNNLTANKFYMTPKRSNVQVNEQDSMLTVDSCLQHFQSSDPSQIIQFCNIISENASAYAKQVHLLIQNSQVQEIICQLIENGSQPYTQSLLAFIEATFPFVGCSDEDFIDNGLISGLVDLLSEENETTIMETIKTIGVVSQYSIYARDACICVGIHTMLIELCAKVRGTDLASQICSTLHDIFGNPEEMDSTVIRDSTIPIVNLLEGQNEDTLRFLLAILADLSSKLPSIVFTYYNLGLYDTICEFLSNPALASSALALVGNMAVAQPAQIRSLIDHGLIPILFDLAQTEDYASDVFWIFSNIVESVPHLFFEVFSDDFLETVLTTVQDASFNAKIEAAFFLATVIVFGGSDKAAQLFDPRVINIFSDVLGCGIETVTLRYIEALISLLVYAQKNNKSEEYIQLLIDNDIEDRLKDFDDDQTLLGQRARFMLLQIIQDP